MNRLKYPASIAVAALAMSFGAAHAQSRITYNQVITNLDSTGGTARSIGINVNQVTADIEARIQAEGTENAKSAPTVLDALKGLPNFIVQIQFDLNSDTVLPQSWESIGRIADALYHPLLAGNRFLIVGHTDATGGRQYNLELSGRRAQAVVDMLVGVFRVDPARLLAIGFGEEQLQDTSNPDDAINRRVQLINIGPA
jgi:OmpA-OmpF porin, OOP family